LSFLACVLVVGAAVFAVTAGPPTAVRLGAAATAMGGGIVSMHYIGMSALHASARPAEAFRTADHPQPAYRRLKCAPGGALPVRGTCSLPRVRPSRDAVAPPHDWHSGPSSTAAVRCG